MTFGAIVLAVLVAVAAAGRAQSLLLARRVDRLVHEGVRDAATGMFTPAAGAVRLRAEVSRVRRTGATVELRRGVVPGGNDVARDAALASVVAALPVGSVAVRTGPSGWAAAVPSGVGASATSAAAAADVTAATATAADATAGDATAAASRDGVSMPPESGGPEAVTDVAAGSSLGDRVSVVDATTASDDVDAALAAALHAPQGAGDPGGAT